MSEKRFTGKLLTNSNGEEFGFTIYDEDKRMSIDEVIGVLNEQQATIRKLQDLCGESDSENAKLRIENKMLEKDKAFAEDYANIFEKENVELRRENKRLEKEVNLLRPTNIEQYEQIQKLQEENEQLRKELGDCEKFRYTVFKRLNDEYIKECSIK